MTRTIHVAHSPDSDDAFMFYGLASGAVKVEGVEVDQVLSDIETLNRAAFEGKYEVTAVSFHAFAHLQHRYALLPHGASIGTGYGPIIVAREAESLDGLRGKEIVVPGAIERMAPGRSRPTSIVAQAAGRSARCRRTRSSSSSSRRIVPAGAAGSTTIASK